MSEIPEDGLDWEPSKPADIPDDVWMSARRGMDYASKRQELIARAIMAERERCARAAELCKTGPGAAAAIRSPPQD